MESLEIYRWLRTGGIIRRYKGRSIDPGLYYSNKGECRFLYSPLPSYSIASFDVPFRAFLKKL